MGSQRGFFALTGCLYLMGFDALALVLGWAAGFTICAVLFTPFLRKSGAYTLPGFFRQRFNSRLAGGVAALLLLPPEAGRDRYLKIKGKRISWR